MRLSEKHLVAKLKTVNEVLGRPDVGYVKKSDGSFEVQKGNIFFENNNIYELLEDTSCRVLHYGESKKECYAFLCGLIVGKQGR